MYCISYVEICYVLQVVQVNTKSTFCDVIVQNDKVKPQTLSKPDFHSLVERLSFFFQGDASYIFMPVSHSSYKEQAKRGKKLGNLDVCFRFSVYTAIEHVRHLVSRGGVWR